MNVNDYSTSAAHKRNLSFLVYMDIRIIHEQPTQENTIHVLQYRAFSPERFSVEDEDKLVVYSGGAGFSLTISDNDPNFRVVIGPQLQQILQDAVEIYVLNSCVLLWSDKFKIGAEIPYQLIVLHALQKLHDQDILHLHLLPGQQLSVEGDSDYEPYIVLTITPTINHRGLSLCPSGTESIAVIYEGLSQCSTLHNDSESITEEENGSEISQDVILNRLGPSDADDFELDILENSDGPLGAGMSIDVGYSSIAGRRKRDDNESQPSKRRL